MRALLLVVTLVCACDPQPRMQMQLEPAPATCDAETIEGDTCALVGVVGFDLRFVVRNVGDDTLEFDRLDDEPGALTGEMPNTGELAPNANQSGTVRAATPFATTITWRHNGNDMPEVITLELSFE